MKTNTVTSKLARLAVMLVALTLTALAREASAHSFPQDQYPSAGQMLAAPPTEIRIKFDAPIEKLFAKLQVLDSEGKDHAIGAPEVSSDGVLMTAKVEALKPGEYTVKWAVLGVDTHHTEGSYSFTIGGGGT